jgi:hypothetical protein
MNIRHKAAVIFTVNGGKNGAIQIKKYYWTAVIALYDSSSRLAGKPFTYRVSLGFKIR